MLVLHCFQCHLYEKCCMAQKGNKQGGRNWEEKSFGATHSPLPPVVKLCCLEEHMRWGSTQPIVCDPLTLYLSPLNVQQQFSKCKKLEWSPYVTDLCQKETKDNLRKKPPLLWEKRKRKSVIHLLSSNGIPYLMCVESNVFLLSLSALFSHAHCWRFAGCQECPMLPVSLTVIWKRMWPKKSCIEMCFWQIYNAL